MLAWEPSHSDTGIRRPRAFLSKNHSDTNCNCHYHVVMARGAKFTAAERDALRTAVAVGKTATEVATAMGRPYGTVRNEASRMGLKFMRKKRSVPKPPVAAAARATVSALMDKVDADPHGAIGYLEAAEWRLTRRVMAGTATSDETKQLDVVSRVLDRRTKREDLRESVRKEVATEIARKLAAVLSPDILPKVQEALSA